MVNANIDRPNSRDNSRQLSIARNFVLQYYTFLNKAPHLAHRFYSHDSTLIHGTLEKPGEKKTDPCVGLDKIKEKIDDLQLNDCRVKIKQIDSLETLGRGLVIQVIGELSNNGAPMRRFLQTFVLAPGPDETSRQQNNKSNSNSANETASTSSTATQTSNNNVNNEQQQQHHHHHNQQQHHHHNQQQHQQLNHSSQTNASSPATGSGSLTSDHSNEKYYVLNNIFRYQDDGTDDDEISSSNINTSIDNPNHISSSVSSSISASTAPTSVTVSTHTPTPTATIQQTGTNATTTLNEPKLTSIATTATITTIATSNTPSITTATTTTSAAATTNNVSSSNATTTTTVTSCTPPANTPTTASSAITNTTNDTPNTASTPSTTSLNTPTINTKAATTTSSVSSTTTTTSYALSDQVAPNSKKDVHNNTNSSSEPKTWANMVSKQTPRGQNRQNRDGPTTPALNQDNGDFRMKEKYPDENQVFVGNLTADINEDDLRDSFKVFGSIQAVRLSKGNFSKSGKPTPDFGFIVFDNPAIVQNILQKKFMMLKNQKLNLEPKRSQAKSGYNNFGRGTRPSSYASRGSREHKVSNHQQQPPPPLQQQSNPPQQSHQQDQLPQHQQSQQNTHKHQHHQQSQQAKSNKNTSGS